MTRLLAAALVVAVAAGCSRHPSPPKTVATSLKVLLPDGQPLKTGEVRLLPERGVAVPNREIEAVARPGPDGTFAVTTFRPEDGAVPGNYVVVIKKGGKAVPTRFQDDDTSDLKVTVPSGGGTLEVRLPG
jgi:hypothetical protein